MRSLRLIASLGIVLVAALFSPQLSQGQFSISTVAGGGPNKLSAVHASIGYAGGVARDGAGNTYITDSYSSQVFKVDGSGNLTVVAGDGSMGYSGDGGPATSAALNRPEAVVVDGSGNIFIADTDNFVIRVVNTGSQAITIAGVVIQAGTIQTVAGNGKEGYSGDGGPATSAQLDDPFGVFVYGSENIFIADTDNFIIREVVASSGNIQTVAGTPGTAGYAGDGGAATSAQLDEPEGVFVDGSGNIFIADTFNSVIREVTAGNISTVAGSYYAWNDTCNYSGDGGPATSAQLCLPNGVFVDGSGDIFIADTNNLRIREVVAAVINTVAGDGTAGYSGDGAAATSAEVNYPSTMVVDGSGDIFIADTDNFVIREVTAGNIETFAGNNTLAYSGDGGLATNAALNFPGEMFVDGAGNIYIADTDSSVIRKVVASTGDIQTVAGNGVSGYSGDGGLATRAELNFPSGVFVDGSGNIFVADTENSVIREVVAATGDIQTIAGDGTPGYAGDGGAPTSAELNSPAGVVLDGSGDIFIADTGNSVIRVVNTGSQATTIAGVVIQAGTIQTVAGNGTACSDPSSGCGDGGPALSAELNFPSGLSVDANDDVFVADTFDDAVREINASSGTIQTVAGTLGQRGYSGDNGSPTSATLDTPYGLYVDSFGNIFVADTDNSAVREVVAVASTIQTIAGNGTAGFNGDNANANNAELAHPTGVSGTASGNIYVADTENLRVRELVSGVVIGVEPVTANVTTTAPQPFAAVVSGTSNSAVTWQVNGITGGNSTIGTISNTGIYTAPANIPSHSGVTVSAVSNANGFTSGRAQVTIVGGNAPNVTVTTNPAGVTEVYTGTTQTFNVTVTGETNTAVNWAVNGVAGGNATIGTISSAGLYTAPGTVPSQPIVVVTAVSQANSALSGAYPFTIVTVPSGPKPAAQTISPGQSATYSLSLNANTGSPSQPITLSCVTSSLPPGASCSFSPAKITPSNKVVPFTLTVSVPSGTASLTPNELWLASQICFGFMPLSGILLIGSKPRRQRGRWLGLVVLCVLLVALSGCGGGGSTSTPPPAQNPEAGTYTIQIQGTTAAQPNPVTITTVGLTVK